VTSSLVEVPAEVDAFTAEALARGWGDGLPLVPPTPARTARFLGGLPPDEVIAELPPSGAPCTNEKLAVNAVMAGAPAGSMALLRASIEAMARRDFDLHALNATTGSVVPAMIVNGPIRDQLGIPYGAGCLGGVAGSAPAIGRAVRLVMRNVAGQRVGATSQSVYGSPGRVAGIVFGEWEERSPWAPLAERRGIPGDAVTVYGAMGTANICDLVADDGLTLLELIGKSSAYSGANGFLTSSAFSEHLICINPIWAEMIGREVPDPAEVQSLLWDHAALPIEWWPAAYHPSLEAAGRIQADGRVHLVQSPDEMLFCVAGGLGNLHAAALHSWGATVAQTIRVDRTVPTD
jgi:hypothetical protein